MSAHPDGKHKYGLSMEHTFYNATLCKRRARSEKGRRIPQLAGRSGEGPKNRRHAAKLLGRVRLSVCHTYHVRGRADKMTDRHTRKGSRKRFPRTGLPAQSLGSSVGHIPGADTLGYGLSLCLPPLEHGSAFYTLLLVGVPGCNKMKGKTRRTKWNSGK